MPDFGVWCLALSVWRLAPRSGFAALDGLTESAKRLRRAQHQTPNAKRQTSKKDRLGL